MSVNTALDVESLTSNGGGFTSGFKSTAPRNEHSIMDKIRNDLSNDDWSEFIKCFDLYINCIFTLENLMDLVTPLLDKYRDKFGDEMINAVRIMAS